QRRRVHPLLLVEGVAHELEAPEALTGGDEREDQPVAFTLRVAADGDGAVGRHDSATPRRGRLDSGGGDDAEELLRVVCGRQRLSESRECLTCASTFGLEL